MFELSAFRSFSKSAGGTLRLWELGALQSVVYILLIRRSVNSNFQDFGFLSQIKGGRLDSVFYWITFSLAVKDQR